MKKVTILVCMMVALAGCSSDKPRDEYVAGAGKGRPLDMPPDLVMPGSDGKYAVPNGPQSSATYSEYAKSGALQGGCACQNAVAAPVPATPALAPVVHPTLQNKPGGGKSIMLAEPFGRCWLRVTQAMDTANITPEDKDRSKGLFYLKGGGRLTVQGNGSVAAPSCEIFATGAKGVADKGSGAVIDALYKALSQQ